MARAADPADGAAAPPGFRYIADVLSADEERELVARLDGLAYREVRMRGVAARRTVVHYGWDYGYDSWTVTPTAPVPEFLVPLRERAGGLAGLPPAALEQVLVARYPAGAGIGWHRDAPMFGPVVVGVSLGAPCVMRFRRGSGPGRDLRRIPLGSRSAYVLSGAARAAWQHSVPPVAALRYSLTFRTLRRDPASLSPARGRGSG
ncbi:MAG TPA: alpha-ketoglutarate-dependent dioxygenase AlkB [Methylomirabilota bacterium]|nr:alpha-ketoglutarate-dependent dioxygenase AlkB [Methylomirabilota bacterium]